MNEETRKAIINWIFNNHYHNLDNVYCSDFDCPYVNSFELEKFINSL